MDAEKHETGALKFCGAANFPVRMGRGAIRRLAPALQNTKRKKSMLSERLQERHEANLEGVHSDLVKIIRHAETLCEIDFFCVEGLRDMKRQRQLVGAGASKTLKSRHLTGHAADLVPVIDGEIRWDWPPFYLIEKAMKQAAKELDLVDALEWGGDWRSFKDGPHWQLSWKLYPVES